jgi:GNAT superfamily N-acetyltransferase
MQDEHRGQGVATRELRAVIDKLARCGVTQLLIDAQLTPFSSMSLFELAEFYKKLGFVEVNNYGEGILMVKVK